MSWKSCRLATTNFPEFYAGLCQVLGSHHRTFVQRAFRLVRALSVHLDEKRRLSCALVPWTCHTIQILRIDRVMNVRRLDYALTIPASLLSRIPGADIYKNSARGINLAPIFGRWSDRMTRRVVRVFCAVFMLSVMIISPLFLDLYPFSVFPMFSENTAEHLFVEITDELGNPLNPIDYGLLFVQLANRQQRYGYDLGPSYFDQHAEIEPSQVKEFLEQYYPQNFYPILVKHSVRGFDEVSARVIDLQDRREFKVAIGRSEMDERIANANQEIFPPRRSNGDKP